MLLFVCLFFVVVDTLKCSELTQKFEKQEFESTSHTIVGWRALEVIDEPDATTTTTTTTTTTILSDTALSRIYCVDFGAVNDRLLMCGGGHQVSKCEKQKNLLLLLFLLNIDENRVELLCLMQ
jgi:hypothetical protein